MRYRAYILWALFAVIILLGIIYVAQGMTVKMHTSIIDFNGTRLTGRLILILAALLLILHAIWTLGAWGGAVFVSISFAMGLVFEIVGVKYGTVFGGRYIYDAAAKPAILGVPWLVPLIWAGFIYGGYSIVSSYSMWLKNGKPKGHRFWNILVTAALGAMIVLAIDLVMDPLQVSAGNWEWLDAGDYFNVPAGNFLGWFMVAFLSIFIFTTVQKYLPRQATEIPVSTLLIPVTGYGLLSLVLAAWALINGMLELAVIGVGAMLPITLANLFLFWRWKKRVDRIGMYP